MEKISYGLDIYNKIRQFNISGKRTIIYQDDFDNPHSESISYDHTHIMECAVSTSSVLGFMLRDLNNEFCSRFTDDLLLMDKRAKAIGSRDIRNHSSLNAIVGEGNGHFFKYSLLGHVYLLARSIFEEAHKNIISNNVRTL